MHPDIMWANLGTSTEMIVIKAVQDGGFQAMNPPDPLPEAWGSKCRLKTRFEIRTG